MSDLTTIYLIRHGRTEWNDKLLIQGHSDSPLTSEGKENLKEIAKIFINVKFDYVFSSDLGRAIESAKILTLEHDLAVKTTKLLRERNFGSLEGGSTKEYKVWDDIMRDLSEEDRYEYKHSPDTESNKEVVERFMTFVREAAVLEPGKTILVVSHGGLIKAVLIKLGFASYDELRQGAVGNGSWVKIETDGVDFFIREHDNIKIISDQHAK